MRYPFRVCESCGRTLVEVDNPIRREVRHRRGEEVQCPAWREAAGLPPASSPDASRDPDPPTDTSIVARNIGLDQAWKGTYAPATNETRADVLVERMEQHQAPERMAAPQPTLDFEMEAV